MGIFFQLAISLVLSTIGYLISPKPKAPTVEPQEFDAPDARADKPMPIIFGTKRVKAVNCIFASDKSTTKRKV